MFFVATKKNALINTRYRAAGKCFLKNLEFASKCKATELRNESNRFERELCNPHNPSQIA